MIWESAPHRNLTRNPVNPGNYMRWKERARSFEGLSAYWAYGYRHNVGDEGSAERVSIGIVAADFFDTLGVAMTRGRSFLESDGVEGAESVVILSSAYWRDRFAADPGILGRELRLDGEKTTIVGIAPEKLDFPLGAQLWTPVHFGPAQREATGRGLRVVARLAPGVSLDSAQAEMKTLAAQLEIERPEVNPMWSVLLTALDQELVGDYRRPLWLLLAAAGAVLLIACSNLSGLLLARNSERRHEFALRTALGADRTALARPLLTEVALLAVVGGFCGLLAAGLGLRLLTRGLPVELPAFRAPELDGAALAWSLAAAAVSALLVGLATTWRMARLDLREALAASSSRTAGGTGSRARSGLVIGQAALCLVLVAGATILGRSLARLLAVDPGFEVGQVFTGQVSPAGPAYATPEQRRTYYRQVERRLAGRSDIRAVGWSTGPLLSGLDWSTDFWAGDRPVPEAGERRVADIRAVTPGFFPAAGLRLMEGRFFESTDGPDAPPVAVLSEGAARELWPGENALGRQVYLWWHDARPAEVVGIVADLRINALGEEPRGVVFRPFDQWEHYGATLFVRGTANPAAAATAIRETLAEVDPTIPIAGLKTLERVLVEDTQQPRFLAGLAGLFTLVALTLTAVGLYGLVAGMIVARRRELGVRAALGASNRRLFGGVMASGLRLVGLGIAIGLPLAVAVAGLLRSVIFEISPYDPWSLAATVVVVLAVGMLACLIPAARATRLDPASILREQ
jgi:predicted permease